MGVRGWVAGIGQLRRRAAAGRWPNCCTYTENQQEPPPRPLASSIEKRRTGTALAHVSRHHKMCMRTQVTLPGRLHLFVLTGAGVCNQAINETRIRSEIRDTEKVKVRPTHAPARSDRTESAASPRFCSRYLILRSKALSNLGRCGKDHLFDAKPFSALVANSPWSPKCSLLHAGLEL
jgi:hypothetical protein